MSLWLCFNFYLHGISFSILLFSFCMGFYVCTESLLSSISISIYLYLSIYLPIYIYIYLKTQKISGLLCLRILFRLMFSFKDSSFWILTDIKYGVSYEKLRNLKSYKFICSKNRYKRDMDEGWTLRHWIFLVEAPSLRCIIKALLTNEYID